MKPNEIVYNNMSTIPQIASWFILMIPLSAAHIYITGTMYDTTWTVMWAFMDLIFFHLITLLLMNTPVVIHENGITVPFAPMNYIKRPKFFPVKDIDSVVYNGIMFTVRRKDGYQRTFRRNRHPFNKPLVENVEKFCKEHDIEFVRMKKDMLGREHPLN